MSGSPKGFKDDSFGNADGNNDYDYDANGNMTRDDNKNISSIVYNHLNLPTQINFGTGDIIEYLYDAAGQKKSKKVTEQGVETLTDYLDGYQYTNAILRFFPHAEGYVNVTYCEACQAQYQYKFDYVYQYKDHLGNIRVSYGYDQKDHVLKIIEENHYYPFGLKHTHYNSGKSKYEPDEEFPEQTKMKPVPVGETVLNKYKYNGKELQDELGLNVYDMEARNYMPDIGRWGVIDELAESFFDSSPYNFSNNNPINFSDPSGMAPERIASTFVNSNSSVVEHRDDGDNNVYLVGNSWSPGGSKSGLKVIGTEAPGETYRKGDKVLFDFDGYANVVHMATGATTAIGGAFDIFGVWDAFFIELFSEIGDGSPGTTLAFSLATKGRVKTSTSVRFLNGLLKFKGLTQNMALRGLTHQQITKAFKDSGYKLSNHAIMRLKDLRLSNMGFTTLNDVKQIFNKGVPFDAGSGAIGKSYKGLEVIINPATKVIMTIRPEKIRKL